MIHTSSGNESLVSEIIESLRRKQRGMRKTEFMKLTTNTDETLCHD